MTTKAELIQQLEETKQKLKEAIQELAEAEEELAEAKNKIDDLKYGDVDGTDEKYKSIEFLNLVLQYHFDTKITLVADRQWGGRIRTEEEIEKEGRCV